MGGSGKIMTAPSGGRRFVAGEIGFSDPEAAREWKKDRASKRAASLMAELELSAIQRRPVRYEGLTEAQREEWEKREDRFARAARKARRNRTYPIPRKFTWRDVPRIELPGWVILRATRFIGRACDGIVSLLVSPAQAIGQRLERHLEQLDDRNIGPADLSGLAALKRSSAIWLTQSPNSARQPIPEETPCEASCLATRDPLPGSDQAASRSSERAS